MVKNPKRKPDEKEEMLEVPEKLTIDFLKRHLLSACDILRGKLDANEFRIPIISIMFLKRLNDVFVENAERLINEGKTKEQAYEESFRHNFFVPKEARWEALALIVALISIVIFSKVSIRGKN